MEIRNHRIDEIWFAQTPNLSAGTITPRFVVTHYTTGWSGEGSRDWLLGQGNPNTSAHVVIDRDGTSWQIAPFNRRAWHAGPSLYKGVVDLNTHAIGLEFVNPGWLKPDGRGGWADYHGNRRSSADLDAFGGFVEKSHPRVGSGVFAWPFYTAKQIEVGLAIVRAIVAKYEIKAIITHEEIDTRGWKTDPGPAFPQIAFKDLLNGSEPNPEELTVAAMRLNVRGGPGTEFDLMDPPRFLPIGTRVRPIRGEGDWRFVEVIGDPYGADTTLVGVRGWVHGGYLDYA
jgi:N-acetylmuramoyl-L-alanine amidase